MVKFNSYKKEVIPMKTKQTNKKNKKMETSKKILWLSYGVTGFLTLIVVICSFIGIECSNITTLAGCAFVEVGSANIFYYTMNKRLNAPKVIMHLYNELPDQLKEQIDINNLFSNLLN